MQAIVAKLQKLRRQNVTFRSYPRGLAHIERIMREGTGADRQLAVWERTQDTKSVVDHIVAETYEHLDVSRDAAIAR
jgi:hypothetical protein